MRITYTRCIHIASVILMVMSFPPPNNAFASAESGHTSYFDMTSRNSSDLSMFPKWTKMLTRFDNQKTISDSDCGKVKYHPCVIKEWKALMNSMHGEPLRKQLDRINDWANAHPYIIDQVNWGMEDFWETPYEFMSVSGDCEDYAIAKYYSLRSLGVSEEKLRVIVVQDFNLGGIIHAVLGVYDDNELLILDNQIRQVRPALKIYHYRPIYGVNEADWWEYFPN